MQGMQPSCAAEPENQDAATVAPMVPRSRHSAKMTPAKCCRPLAMESGNTVLRDTTQLHRIVKSLAGTLPLLPVPIAQPPCPHAEVATSLGDLQTALDLQQLHNFGCGLALVISLPVGWRRNWTWITRTITSAAMICSRERALEGRAHPGRARGVCTGSLSGVQSAGQQCLTAGVLGKRLRCRIAAPTASLVQDSSF